MTNKDISEIKKIINPLIGKKAWDVSLGHGTFITMNFGEFDPFEKDEKHTRGEWYLWIYCCSWRLEQQNKMIAASEDSRSKSEKSVKQLENLIIQSIELFSPIFDTVFVFEKETILRSFSAYSEGYEHWMLFTPDKHVLVIGPGNNWSYKRSDK